MIKIAVGKSKDLLKINTRDSILWQANMITQTIIWQLHHILFVQSRWSEAKEVCGRERQYGAQELIFARIGMAKGEDLCLVKLSKSYEDIEKLLNLWNETDRHSNELIQSLTSPLEQLHSCEKACFKRSPLGDFEGLKEKLKYKLLKQTEIIMAKLQDDM